jgi:multiple sugar transport system substrate-binding protein
VAVQVAIFTSLIAGATSAVASPPAAAHRQVTLTWWTWTANPNKVIANFEKAYPWITIAPPPNYGAGNSFLAKLQTALGTGTGPDVSQVNQESLQHFILTHDLLDISKYDSSYKNAFPPAIWDEVSQGHALYAMPEDIGPAGLAYRPSVLSQYHLAVPKTWAQFAQEAVTLHKDNPKLYMTYFPVNDGGYIQALFSQTNYATYKALPNGSYYINYNVPAIRNVVNFWGKLIDEHAVLGVDDYAPLWGHEIATGTFASYVAAAWSPTYTVDEYLSSSVPQTFQVTKMPQWAPNGNVAGNFGGSTNAVTKDCPPNLVADAALFAAYINTTTSGLQIDELPSSQGGRGLFPAALKRDTAPEFSKPFPHFIGNINAQFATYANQMSPQFQWSPWELEFENFLTTELGKAAAGTESWSQALANAQQQLVSYVRDAGYTVQT